MLLQLLCFVLYFACAAVVVAGLFDKNGPNKKLIWVLASAALLLHAFVLRNSIFGNAGIDLHGQNMSMLNVASLIAWIISISMLLASLSMRNTILLSVVYGFTALIIVLNAFMPIEHVVHIEANVSLIAHISLALFAYATLSIALLFAIQLSYINMRLKEKKASLLNSSLPPLLVVENILFKLLSVGTILLTLSLVTGFIFLENMWANEQAHKTVLSIMAWAIYVLIVLGHSRFGWRGKPIVVSTVVGSSLLTLAYFGSRFVKEIIIA